MSSIKNWDTYHAENMVNRSRTEATAYAVLHLWDWRIVREDDTRYMVTDDLIPERANIEIDKGMVTKVTWG